MTYGMGYGSGLPSNYQNGMYWQYLMQTMQQTQQMQKAKYNDALAMIEAQRQQQSVQGKAVSNAEAAVQNPVAVQSVQLAKTGDAGDGKDDGKISFGKKCKNFGKGVLNFFKGMVCDEKGDFSIKRTLTTAAVAAGAVALTVATGGAATPFLIAGGVALAGAQTGKGIINAIAAKTDAEAEAAWQEIGSGTTALVGAVAGAKGALKSAGAPIPEGNAVTSSLKATWDCMKIAKNGVWNGGKAAILHPMQSGRAVAGYFKNTVKPNLVEAFSYKNGHRNYTNAMEEKFNNQIKDIDTKIKALNDELAASPTPERAAEINAKLAELTTKKSIVDTRLDSNNAKGKALADIEKDITEIEAKLADTSVSAADKAALTTEREELYQLADMFNVKYKNILKNNLADKENLIKGLNEKLKTAPESDRASIKANIKVEETLLKGIKQQAKIELAQDNVLRGEADIIRLKDNLRVASTDAEKQSLTARIARIEKAIATDKKILKNANYQVAAKAHLPNVGLAYGTYYLANPAPQTEGPEASDQLAEADAYAQANGFESAAAMQQYLDSMQSSQQALNNANQYLASNNSAYGNMNMPSIYSLPVQPPVSSGLDFNALYKSPYPPMF